MSCLERVEISDFSTVDPLDPEVLPALFAGARRLRVLVLGALQGSNIPASYRLESGTLEELDVEFYRPTFVGALIASMHLPGLRTLTVRHVYSHLPYLLANIPLLSSVDSFTAYGAIGDYGSLDNLFRSMPVLRHLDLSNSTAEAFRWYCLRVFRSAKLRVPDCSSHLRSLAVGRVSVRMVLRYLECLAGSPTYSLGITQLRMESPPADRPATTDLEMVRAIVKDFSLTKKYFYPRDSDSGFVGTTTHLLTGATVHSLFTSLAQ
ncbi:hypothetical protein B0H16DRAFT_1461285 [Mycena metata]|uniref:Uncharacterized protein n=1 Tax=Mycena metata TaxID=1033252 RepID=A0AAD7IU08_9AGAR|nr:hypothetical protein B0H16DRAFT_1461285 [Mycena metata]